MTKMARIPLNSSQNTHYKFEIEVTHLIDLDPGLFPFSARSHSDFYSIRRTYDEPLLEQPEIAGYYNFPTKFIVSFSLSPQQLEVHVLPKFTSIEILAMIGGLIFAISLLGKVLFKIVAKFWLQNYLIERLYKGIVPPVVPPKELLSQSHQNLQLSELNNSQITDDKEQ